MTTGNSLINLGDLSQPVTILIEKISNAIGVVYEPTKIRRNAKAEAEANRITVLADLDLQSEVENRGIQRLITQQTRKQINIENIIQQSIEELPKETEVEKLDEDWLAYFFDNCENISNETMQTVWSKILTGEATRSGSFSKRTINIVSNIDQKDAELFTNFCQFVWNIGVPIPVVISNNDREILKENSISFNDLTHLQSIGLITLSVSDSYRIKDCSRKEVYSYFDRSIQFEFQKEKENDLPIGACLLTATGRELFEICDLKANMKYLNYMINYYQGEGITLTDIT